MAMTISTYLNQYIHHFYLNMLKIFYYLYSDTLILLLYSLHQPHMMMYLRRFLAI
jgi:hypothetical protein